MNREIKFRAWDGHKMYQNVDILDGCLYDRGKKVWEYVSDKLISEDCEVMQFTGVKDKGDKDIYEGDVIDCNWCNGFYLLFFLSHSC